MCHTKSTQHTFPQRAIISYIGATVQVYSCPSDMQVQNEQLRRLVIAHKVVTEREDGVKSVCIGGTLPL